MTISPTISKALIVIVFLSFTAISCGSPSNPGLIDEDHDGIWDVNDEFPGDTDNDGILNVNDNDDDNDGVLDTDDAFPYNPYESVDTDQDGIGNNADEDDDGDGILDIYDIFPLDPAENKDTDGDGIGDNADQDADGDGFGDDVDLFPIDANQAGDHDGDGVDSLTDLDDDNDGYLDSVEIAEGSNSLDASIIPSDSDSDFLTDLEEARFGSNPNLPDSDNDGLLDRVEREINSNPVDSDTDGDGYDDLTETGNDFSNLPDFDGDGIIDTLDYYLSFEFRVMENDPEISHDRFGISSDESNNIYVANYLDNTIHVFSYDGAANGTFAADGFLNVNDLAIVNAGSLFVSDTNNNRIIEIDSADQVVDVFEHQPDGSPGGFIAPRGVDADADGNLYVADTWDNRIQRYIVGGGWEAAGAPGSEEGNFTNPQDIAVSNDGLVAVADTGNFRIQLFDSSLSLIDIIDSLSLNIIPFDFRPRSVAFGPTGNLFILDDSSSRVVVVNQNGELLYSFGSEGTENGEFIFPTGIHVDDSGKVFVTDRNRVQVF